MAVVRNITNDDLTIRGGAVVKAGAEHNVEDAEFVDQAWPKSTWSVARKPSKDYVDASPDDAHLFVTKPDESLAELKDRAAVEGVDITGLTKKDDIAAALAAGRTEESA